jgi:hypothetical protein
MNARRPSRRGGESVDLGDRLVSAVFGGIVGAAVGFVVALLLAGGSHWVHVGDFSPSFRNWTIGTGAVFALAGLAFGARAASLLGDLISAIWTAEAYAYWWYWPWRIAVAVIGIGLLLAFLR